MEIRISKGNSKIGRMLNISLPPGVSCLQKDKTPSLCFYSGCYAKQSFIQYPSVRDAWVKNWWLWKSDPIKYFGELCQVISKTKDVKFFRWHVGGDIPNQSYYDKTVQVAELFPDVQFLAFTKKYHLDFGERPKNLVIVLSVWPGIELPDDSQGLPFAWLSEDERRDPGQMYVKCPGSCEDCQHKCWTLLDKDVHVVFDKH